MGIGAMEPGDARARAGAVALVKGRLWVQAAVGVLWLSVRVVVLRVYVGWDLCSLYPGHFEGTDGNLQSQPITLPDSRRRGLVWLAPRTF